MKPNDASFYRDVLAKAVPFSGLPPAALDHIIRRGMLLEAKKGDPVFFENMRGGIGLYVIVAGVIGVFRSEEPEHSAPDSDRIHLNDLKPGDCFGEYSLFDGLSTSASASAQESAWLFFLPRGEFHQMFERDPLTGNIIYRNLLLYLIRRLREKDRK